jgi:hypothetical protein
MADTFVLKGCWKRKEVVHPIEDKATVMRLAGTHPWTINSTAEFKAEYTRIYGVVEAGVLIVKGKGNMVESFEPSWVQGGTKVEADPKPPVAPADANDLGTPFGIHRVPGEEMDLSKDAPDLDALIDGIMVRVLKRAGLWRGPQ